MNEQDRRRKRAMIVFQIVAYGWLLAIFLVQVTMYMSRDW